MNETSSRLESLGQEQQRLHRRLYWMLGWTLAWPLLVLGAGFAVFRTPPATSSDLRVSRLVLVDEAGRSRGTLELDAESREPRLVLTHADGKRWAALEVAALPGAPQERRQATFVLHDETGEARVGMGASSQDSGLAVYQSQGVPGLVLYQSQDARGLVVLNNRVPRIHLRYNQHDDSELSELLFWDEEKRVQVDVTAGRGGTSMTLQNPDGQRVFSAP